VSLTSPLAEPDVLAHETAVNGLLDSLKAALLGADHAEPLHPSARPAFAAEVPPRPITLGEGLLGIVRATADTSTQVLCIHNLTDRPVDFTADALWPEAREGSLHHMRGETSTSLAEGGALAFRLAPHSFVWIASLPLNPTA
jgi:hypothetical protein